MVEGGSSLEEVAAEIDLLKRLVEVVEVEQLLLRSSTSPWFVA